MKVTQIKTGVVLKSVAVPTQTTHQLVSLVRMKLLQTDVIPKAGGIQKLSHEAQLQRSKISSL